MNPLKNIIIRGARQHNLKDINLDLPIRSLVVITGLSGSGKSSLAFDTLYAEGQRRYVESLSTYTRQFLERLEKPDVDLIEGLSPAIAIEQKTAGHNPRSTVGTVTELHDFLRILFSRVGTPHCPRCGREIHRLSLDQMMDRIMSLPSGSRVHILAPMISGKKASGKKNGHDKLLSTLKRDGFSRIRLSGEIHAIESLNSLPKKRYTTVDVVVDRLVIKQTAVNRVADSVELALRQSGGKVVIEILNPDEACNRELVFNEKSVCHHCGIDFPEFSPAAFSFNSPQGACASCGGLGSVNDFDPDLIVPNHHLSLREGAVAPWTDRGGMLFIDFLEALARPFSADIWTPFDQLPQPLIQTLLYGTPDTEKTQKNTRIPKAAKGRPFEGVIPQLKRRFEESGDIKTRREIECYMTSMPCPVCGGSRLNPFSAAVRVGKKTITQINQMPIADAVDFFKTVTLSSKNTLIAQPIVTEIRARLNFLLRVGLGYISLARSATTLSGGESQRIRLATQIGSKLTGVLYVLDEPSIGLHQKDNLMLLGALKEMKELGNTVLVVEHDKDTILSADHVVDMGPGAGINGGHVVFSGTPDMLLADKDSLTGLYLSGKRNIPVPASRRKGYDHRLIIKRASANNLKQIDVSFPLGRLICVTGVSGSGKSTLVLDTLYRAIRQRLHRSRILSGKYNIIKGLSNIDKVVHVDQSPIGRTPRSNPGTYTGILGHVRELYAKTPDARMRGFKPGRFSFNVKGGRCESCRGDGIVKIEMHFLPDIYVSCNVCRGKRYNRETLEIRYKGRNIAETLNLTVNQALDVFKRVRSIREKLETLAEVGLGYIRIGQAATTLSGGETQRMKLARELSKRGTGRTLYIMDEPTTGLHMDDIKKLLHVTDRLVAAGNTVLIIEHNLDVIKTADYVIDLGPEGGDAGGEVVVCGTPEVVAAHPSSHTGRFLKKVLNPHGGIKMTRLNE